MLVSIITMLGIILTGVIVVGSVILVAGLFMLIMITLNDD